MQDEVQEDADLQIKWSKWMSDDKAPGFYRRVFVLLLSWHPDCDDIGVDEEVIRTSKIRPSSVSDISRYNVWELCSKRRTILLLSLYALIVGRKHFPKTRQTLLSQVS